LFQGSDKEKRKDATEKAKKVLVLSVLTS